MTFNRESIKNYLRESREISTEKISIALDFDGTVVTNEYPNIGEENDECAETLKRWIRDYNVEIILDTMRSDDKLEAALNWFNERGIEISGVGKHPNQENWTNSTKAYAMFSIDDRNVGVPLIVDRNGKPRVDWGMVEYIFEPVLERLNKKYDG